MWKSYRFITQQGEEVIIRPAVFKDAGEFLLSLDEVCKEGVYLLHERVTKTVDEQGRIIRMLDNDRNILVVAELNGRVVGGMGIFSGSVLPKSRYHCNVGIHLIRSARGKGIGSTMIAYGLEWAKEKKYHKICLSVFSSNSKAINLYKRYGFIEEGKRREQYMIHNRFVDEILMAKFL